jgi:hypothetical protein
MCSLCPSLLCNGGVVCADISNGGHLQLRRIELAEHRALPRLASLVGGRLPTSVRYLWDWHCVSHQGLSPKIIFLGPGQHMERTCSGVSSVSVV